MLARASIAERREGLADPKRPVSLAVARGCARRAARDLRGARSRAWPPSSSSTRSARWQRASRLPPLRARARWAARARRAGGSPRWRTPGPASTLARALPCLGRCGVPGPPAADADQGSKLAMPAHASASCRHRPYQRLRAPGDFGVAW